VLARVNGSEHSPLAFEHFNITEVGLCSDDTPTQNEWYEVGRVLQRIGSGIQWLWGDWIEKGEKVWGKTYAEAVEISGLDSQTLQDYAWVARHVHQSLRKRELSFNHHKVIAHLSEADQVYWLNEALEKKWTVAEMRAEINPRQLTASDFPAYDHLKRKLLIFKQLKREELQPHSEDERALMIELFYDHIHTVNSLINTVKGIHDAV